MSLELFREDLNKHGVGSPCYINQMTFEVARFGTMESKAQVQEIRDQLYGLFPDPKQVNDNEIFAHWLANFGVVNWSGVADTEDGEEIPFSRSMATKIFLNKEYWGKMGLNDRLITHAVNYENYLHDAAYEDTEELKKP